MPPDPRKLVSSETGGPVEWDKASMYDRVNYFLESIRKTPGYSVRTCDDFSICAN